MIRKRRTVSEADKIALRGALRAVRGDYVEAKRLFEIAIARGSADGHRLLGALYLNGHGVERNTALGWRHVRHAAECGSVVAQYDVARSYLAGASGQRNEALALRWMLKSARGGNLRAVLALAYMYYTGSGARRNYRRALSWARGSSFLPIRNFHTLRYLGYREIRHEWFRLVLLAKLNASRLYWFVRGATSSFPRSRS